MSATASKKNIEVPIHWICEVFTTEDESENIVFILCSRKAKKYFYLDDRGVKSHKLQNVSSSDKYHQGYFCMEECWDRLKGLTEKGWQEEQAKKASNPTHEMRQACIGVKFMEYFVLEAMAKKVTWSVDRRALEILTLLRAKDTKGFLYLCRLIGLQNELKDNVERAKAIEKSLDTHDYKGVALKTCKGVQSGIEAAKKQKRETFERD
ncbi:hypothetical protein EAF04_000916 [Stromatinia cepivora]|nr:hypothetical protein EAF04_000916 [Stromatinia cepivora]